MLSKEEQQELLETLKDVGATKLQVIDDGEDMYTIVVTQEFSYRVPVLKDFPVEISFLTRMFRTFMINVSDSVKSR